MRGTSSVPCSTAAKEIASDDAALLRHGSGGWLLIRYVYNAAPLPVGVQTPDRYSPEMNRHWCTVWPGRGQFVLAAHVGSLPSGENTGFSDTQWILNPGVLRLSAT